MKIFEWFIRMLYWLQAFVASVIFFGLVALLIYSKTENKTIALFLLSIGFLGGIFLAEFIRRRYGLEDFFAGIHGSSRIDRKSAKKFNK
jgi:hypothetical protein